MNTNDERADFEAWYRKEYGHDPVWMSGLYFDAIVATLWRGWQAARAQPERSGDAVALVAERVSAPEKRIRPPIQPLYVCPIDGRLRFQPNVLVQHLLDHGGLDMNALARIDAPRSDREQFAQLIGYSHYGFGTLSYATDRVYDVALERYERRMNPVAARAQPERSGDAVAPNPQDIAADIVRSCAANGIEVDSLDVLTAVERALPEAAPPADARDAGTGSVEVIPEAPGHGYWLPQDAAAIVWNALQDMSNEQTYRGERTGGVLAGCTRAPDPTPRELAGRVGIIFGMFKRAIRKIAPVDRAMGATGGSNV